MSALGDTKFRGKVSHVGFYLATRDESVREFLENPIAGSGANFDRQAELGYTPGKNLQIFIR